MPERWIAVPGYEGRYEVSDGGRVRSIIRAPRLKNPSPKGRGGYVRVRLSDKSATGKMTDHLVHRLVMRAFVGPCPDGMVVCHNNGSSDDNRLANLRYDTPAENTRDIIRHGRNPYANATHCPKGHPYDDVNTRITPKGHRRCRACHRSWESARYRDGRKPDYRRKS